MINTHVIYSINIFNYNTCRQKVVGFMKRKYKIVCVSAELSYTSFSRRLCFSFTDHSVTLTEREGKGDLLWKMWEQIVLINKTYCGSLHFNHFQNQ